jgi:tripartite-type tricarboxylate transporter receptor subunit TctC
MVDMAAIDIESMTGMTVDDLNPVIATERVPFFLIQRSDAPWGDTLDEFVAYAQANPGTVRHITGGPGGGMDAAMRFWLGGLGITVNDVIGGNPTERALAVASGEGDITASPPDVLGPHFDAGKVELLLGAGANAFPAPWDAVVPSETRVGTADPFSQTRTIATSPDVPVEHRDWLYQLFSAAAQDPAFVEQRSQVTALQLVDLDPQEAKDLAMYGLDVSVTMFKELGIYWGDM